MTNRETSEFYNKAHHNISIVDEGSEQHSRLGSNKRLAPTSRYVSWSQPPASKRCRRNSSSSEPEGIELNSRNLMDPEYSCSSNNSSNFSPSQQPCHQNNQHHEHTSDETTVRNQQRLLRTTEMLKESGLYDVAVRTAALIRQNQQSRKELEELREETKLFLRDVLNNPENAKINQILNGLEQDKQNLQDVSQDISGGILNS